MRYVEWALLGLGSLTAIDLAMRALVFAAEIIDGTIRCRRASREFARERDAAERG